MAQRHKTHRTLGELGKCKGRDRLYCVFKDAAKYRFRKTNHLRRRNIFSSPVGGKEPEVQRNSRKIECRAF